MRFTLRQMMFVIAVVAICIAVGKHTLRIREEQRLRLEKDAIIAALQAQWLSEGTRAIIRAEEWQGNPRRPTRSMGSPSLEEMQKAGDELKKCEAELDRSVAPSSRVPRN